MTILNTAVRRVLLAVFLIALFASQSYAIATYTYAGNNYTTATSPFTTSMNITGSFSLANHLSPNLFLTAIEGQLVSLNFNDGVTTYTLATPNLNIQSFFVGTDGFGNINEWIIGLDTLYPTPTQTGDTRGALFTNTFLDQAFFNSCITVVAGVCTGQSVDSGVSRAPGTWRVSTSSVPEPGSLFLLLSGFAGLGFMRLVRKKK